jgi:AraC-like DNA-binding protein
MIYRESLPPLPLQSLVCAYWSLQGEAADVATPRRILPDGCADLICDFAAPAATMRWVGTMTHAIDVRPGGRQDLFGIRFAPGGLYPLLGAPLSLLTDDSAEFTALPARAWFPPLEEWCADIAFDARCARATASLSAMLPRLQFTPMLALLRHLSRVSALPSSATDLSDRTGWSLRTLQRHFMDQLGVSPRQHLRYLRFERARNLLVQRELRAADIAAAAGYADQAHFIREFRRFAGITPGRWC